MNILMNQKEFLIKKEKYRYHDRDDPDYYGIRDIGNLFGKVDEKDYYQYYSKVLLKVVAKNMKTEETKAKNYQ